MQKLMHRQLPKDHCHHRSSINMRKRQGKVMAGHWSLGFLGALDSQLARHSRSNWPELHSESNSHFFETWPHYHWFYSKWALVLDTVNDGTSSTSYSSLSFTWHSVRCNLRSCVWPREWGNFHPWVWLPITSECRNDRQWIQTLRITGCITLGT